ncbi:hypothetical protein B0H14DRAFT_3494960 [Mycena olivaceomarginata]|nr:hypothetical protein B0H14DRAFT_3494960 [Mycena olivaceomarginata]
MSTALTPHSTHSDGEGNDRRRGVADRLAQQQQHSSWSYQQQNTVSPAIDPARRHAAARLAVRRGLLCTRIIPTRTHHHRRTHPPTYKPDPPGWPAPLRAASSSALAPASTSALPEDAAKAPAQDEDEPPLAWAASWLHPPRAPRPRAQPCNNATSGKEEGGRATPSALQLTASPTFVSFTQKLLETTQLSQSVIVLALHYIHRLRARNAATPRAARLRVSSRATPTRTPPGPAVSLIPLAQINTMEREFLVGCDYNLYVSQGVYEDWGRLLRGLGCMRTRPPSTTRRRGIGGTAAPRAEAEEARVQGGGVGTVAKQEDVEMECYDPARDAAAARDVRERDARDAGSASRSGRGGSARSGSGRAGAGRGGEQAPRGAAFRRARTTRTRISSSSRMRAAREQAREQRPAPTLAYPARVLGGVGGGVQLELVQLQLVRQLERALDVGRGSAHPSYLTNASGYPRSAGAGTGTTPLERFGALSLSTVDLHARDHRQQQQQRPLAPRERDVKRARPVSYAGPSSSSALSFTPYAHTHTHTHAHAAQAQLTPERGRAAARRCTARRTRPGGPRAPWRSYPPQYAFGQQQHLAQSRPQVYRGRTRLRTGKGKAGGEGPADADGADLYFYALASSPVSSVSSSSEARGTGSYASVSSYSSEGELTSSDEEDDGDDEDDEMLDRECSRGRRATRGTRTTRGGRTTGGGGGVPAPPPPRAQHEEHRQEEARRTQAQEERRNARLRACPSPLSWRRSRSIPPSRTPTQAHSSQQQQQQGVQQRHAQQYQQFEQLRPARGGSGWARRRRGGACRARGRRLCAAGVQPQTQQWTPPRPAYAGGHGVGGGEWTPPRVALPRFADIERWSLQAQYPAASTPPQPAAQQYPSQTTTTTTRRRRRRQPRRAVFANAGPPGVSGYAYAY